MRAAISIWNDRVSPVMDTSEMLVIYEVSCDGPKECGKLDICGLSQKEKIEMLERAGVEVLVCGAVSNRFMRHIGSARIDLIPWVSGGVDMILEALSRGKLGPDEYLMPGCPRRHGRGLGGEGRGGHGRRIEDMHARGGRPGRRRRSDIDGDSSDVDGTD